MTTGHVPLLTRRDLLIRGGKASMALAAFGLTGPTIFAAGPSTAYRLGIVTPGVTEGPYWVEELLVRSDIRVDPTTGFVQPGFPLKLNLAIWKYLANGTIAPLKGAIVDIWHANSIGLFSDEQMNGTVGQKFLRGTQISRPDGGLQFITIYPGWYSGRTPHVHLRVRLIDTTTNTISYNFVTQVFFNEAITNNVFAAVYPYNIRPVRDTINATDSIYTGASTDDELTADAGTHLMLGLSGDYRGITGKFNIVIDLSDAGYNNATGSFSAPTGGGPGGPPRAITSASDLLPSSPRTTQAKALPPGASTRDASDVRNEQGGRGGAAGRRPPGGTPRGAGRREGRPRRRLHHRGGREVRPGDPDRRDPRATVRIADNGIIVTDKDKKDVYATAYKLEPADKEGCYKVTLTSKLSPNEGAIAKGLIEKKGDTVRLIYALPGGDEPTEFKTKAKQLMFEMKNLKKWAEAPARADPDRPPPAGCPIRPGAGTCRPRGRDDD